MMPKVGVGCLVIKDGKILMHKRLNAHGAGHWGGTGGHLEYMESIEECIRRESMEEAGIEIENVRLLCVTNFKDHAPKHYVDIGLIADWKSGEPRVCEPHKCVEWGWFDMNETPEPLFGPLKNYIESYRTGKVFFDA
ncbi:MAG: NUDIX domain-containing protein [Patescibacteria group bacterium]|nr:NUDIX domain-containing protein [Patescibacteria group bacterium]